MSDTTQKDFDPHRSRWIPWAFVGFMLTVVVVNAFMVVQAVTTFTGVTHGRSYDRGRTYNDVLAEAARQEALGWHAAVTLDAGHVMLQVRDRDGKAVPGVMTGYLRRPVQGTRIDLILGMTEPGRFVAELPEVAAGQWDVRATLRGPGGERLDIHERVFAR
ncbi:MAG: FixH family protein [Acetobacteraceae bacterium]|nr:FixH family protein [Acetobacteraceae bacterium]